MALRDIFDLRGKIAIVTGASGGIGRVLAAALAEYGAGVILVGRNQAPLEGVAAEIEQNGGQAVARSADVLSASDLKGLVDDVVARFGRIDILVNSAGTNVRKWMQDLTEADWDKVVDLNVKGTFLACQAVGRVMIEQQQGKIVNLTSTRALTGYNMGYAPYCASKGAVNLLTRQLAVEWGKYNITVNAIGPTTLRTPLTVSLLGDKEYHDKLLRQTPLGRVGEPGDLVGALVYFTSPASDYVTGQILYVDGGLVVAG